LTLPAHAFNLWHDIEQQTQWTLGENAAAGTSVNIRNGQFDSSEFAGISSYRFLSFWYGGINIPQSDNTIKLTDAAKFGFNLNYFLTGFANQPPQFLQRLVIGPAIACSIITTPRVVNYFVDVNYVFGNVKTLPMPPAPTLAAPTVPVTSKLNLFYGPTSG
jgi:hypothetical protein